MEPPSRATRSWATRRQSLPVGDVDLGLGSDRSAPRARADRSRTRAPSPSARTARSSSPSAASTTSARAPRSSRRPKSLVVTAGHCTYSDGRRLRLELHVRAGLQERRHAVRRVDREAHQGDATVGAAARTSATTSAWRRCRSSNGKKLGNVVGFARHRLQQGPESDLRRLRLSGGGPLRRREDVPLQLPGTGNGQSSRTTPSRRGSTAT